MPQTNPSTLHMSPIQTTLHISNILYITHIHLQTLKDKFVQCYIRDNTTLTILSGDIETNPGPHSSSLHINLNNIHIHHYTWNNATLILLIGDIETHPGPLTQILNNLPMEYTQRQQQYFIQNTLTLKQQYSHLKETFKPYISHHPPPP